MSEIISSMLTTDITLKTICGIAGPAETTTTTTDPTTGITTTVTTPAQPPQLIGGSTGPTS